MEIAIRPSYFVEKILKINGKPFSLEGRDYLRKIYDGAYNSFLLKAGRQVEKSTTLAARMIAYALLIPHFQQLYVSPSAEQTRTFSSQKLLEFINSSEFIQKYYVNSSVARRVYERSFTNGSRIMLAYAFLTADRIRGKSADAVYIDEIQDILYDNIPVIEETMSHSSYGHRVYAGTPKHQQTTIEFFWDRSTQTEWVIKCEHCNNWNIIDERNLQPKGLVCNKCGRLINPKNGLWVDMVSDAYIKAIRLPQVIAPWISWDSIWRKYMEYPKAKFYNEVLALPYSDVANVLTREDLIKASDNYPLLEKYDPVVLYNMPTYMGIDWSTSTSDTGSYTAVVIGTFINGKFRVVYMKRYQGLEIEITMAMKDIIRLAREFHVKLIGADWGVGSGGANATIREALGNESKLFELFEMYYSANQKEIIKWDNKGNKFILNRTETLTNTFMAIKRVEITFPRYSDWSHLSEDFLNVFVDYNKNNVIMYNKAPGKTDDLLHALNFCYTIASIDVGKQAITRS